MSAPTPREGERWRVTIEGAIVEAPTAGTGNWAVIKVGDHCRRRDLGEGTWERLPDPEPEWQPGDLVIDAHGGVWRRRIHGDDDVTAYPWIAVNSGDWETDRALPRPLRRLVPEEAPRG